MALEGVPSHKVIPGTGFIIDGFKESYDGPNVKGYYLSHAHADHYAGLSETWDNGVIYCSEQTARLIQHMDQLRIKKDLIRPLPMDTPVTIDGMSAIPLFSDPNCGNKRNGLVNQSSRWLKDSLLAGVEVTLVDANHCPGAVQFLFKLPDGRKFIHCGDMRFGDHLMGNEHLQRFVGADAVFLDTTYCKSKHQFPPQDEAVEHVASTMERLMSENVNHRRLYLIQTYGIGKERVFIEVARRCNIKLYCSERKRGVMECLDMPGIDKDAIFTTNPRNSPVHIVIWGFLGEAFPFFKPNFTKMEEYGRDMGADEVIGWVPTGWTYENKRNMFPVKKKGNCSIHLVPYSEHSSYSELQTYVKFLRPHEVIPTVGVEGDDAEKKRLAMLKHFSRLVDSSAKKVKFLSAFQKRPRSGTLEEQPGAADSSTGKTAAGADEQPDDRRQVIAAESNGRKTAAGADKQSDYMELDCGMHGDSMQRLECDTKQQASGLAEVGVKAEEEEVPRAGAQAETVQKHEAAVEGKRSGSDVEISSCDTDVNAEDLEAIKDEMEEALQEDGDDLDSDEEVEKPSMDENVQGLLNILGTKTSTLEARHLLFRAGGDIGRALNLHYDEPLPAGSASAAALKVEPGDTEAPPAKLKVVQAPAQSPKAARSKATASIRTAKQPKAKRKASTGTGKKQPSAKKSKVEDPHQRTLASFLASPSRPAAPSSSLPAVKTEQGAQAAAHIAHASSDPRIKEEQGVGATPCTAPASSAPTIKAEQGVEPKVEAEEVLQAAHRAHSAAPEEGREDPLAGISVENQMKIERAIERAAAAKRQKQEKEAENRVLTDPNEGGFVKQGPDPSEIAAAVPAAAVVAELSVGDILADSMAEAEAPENATKHEPSAGTMHSGDGQTTEASTPQEPSRGCGQHVAGSAPTALHVPVKAEPNAADASGLQAPVKLEEAGGGVLDAMLEQTADVKADDPVVEKQQLRQLGMFSSARSNTKGVANALIEKRKIRQRKAGIGSSEDNGSAAANGQADAAKSSEAPALAQETQKPEDGAVTWQDGKPAPYLLIARAFAAMEGTTKRLKKDEIMVDAFRAILKRCPEDLLPAAYLVCGKIAPEHEGLELNVGGSIISAAIREATGVTRQRLSSMYDSLGDPGDVAEACRHTQTMLIQPAALTVRGVYKSLHSMAEQKGAGATARRKQTILHLLRSCRDCETRYLVRTLVSNLRVGANWRSVIGALARAILLHAEPTRPTKVRLDAAATAAVDAFHVCPSLDILVPTLIQHGSEALHDHIALTPGVPLKPMLASITEGVPDALKQLGVEDGLPFLAEYKYDGIRAQIHLLKSGEVRIFSRNCEDRSQAFPDVATAIRTAADGGCKEVVLDAELVAIDRDKSNELKSFQELSTRARGAVAASEVKVPVCVFAFDCLFVDGETLLKETLEARRARMAAALPGMRPGFVCLAKSHRLQGLKPTLARQAQPDTGAGKTSGAGNRACADSRYGEIPSAERAGAEELHAGDAVTDLVSEDEGADGAAQSLSMLEKQAPGPQDIDMSGGEPVTLRVTGEVQEASVEALIREHLQDALAAGTEGLMLKALTGLAATYQPSKRSTHWLKIKRDYCEELRDSLDLVPIGAWHGNGRKVGWYSPFLLAAYDPDTEEFQSVCRCMSGYTDAFYAEATERYKQRVLPEKRAYFSTNERPDVWFEPTEVWEIRGADLTLSAVHKSAFGLLHPTRGVSLRFPRFIRLREDKNVEDASTPEVIRQLFNAQTRKLQIAQETVAKRDGKPQPQPVEEGADAEGGEDPEENE